MDFDDAFSLIFTNETRVAGQDVSGTLILNVPLMLLRGIEEVHVNLRGEVTTRIGSHEEVVYPLHDMVGIWKKSSLSEAELRDGHVLKKPFSYTLPYSSAVSGEYGKEGKGCTWPARVLYYVEAVAVHADPTKPDLRTDRVFKYLNSDMQGGQLSDILQLQNAWAGNWQTIERMKVLRRRFLWTNFGEASISLSLPEIEGLPINTPIPFLLNVMAVAKGKKSRPTTQSVRLFGIDFTIVRDVTVRAHSQEMTIQKEFVARIGSFGRLAEENPEAIMQAEMGPWLPVYDDEKHPTGTWKQEYHIDSSFRLTCPPSTEYQTLSVRYFAQVKVTSRGMDADVILTVPIRIVSNCY